MIHLASFTKLTRLQVQNELAAAVGLSGATLSKAETGKPYLKSPDGKRMGVSISHIRRQSYPVSLMAVAERSDFAIDAESWPTNVGSSAFLTSIMTPEDKPLVASLSAIAADPSVLLWATKEAALKASGDVMNDPRHLSASLSRNGHILVKPSTTASAPMAAAEVRLYKLNLEPVQTAILLALAFTEATDPDVLNIADKLQLVGAQGNLQLLTLQ